MATKKPASKSRTSSSKPNRRATTGKKDLSRVVSFAIHPALGAARVGNAPTEYFMAPEAPGIIPDPNDAVPGRNKDWRPGFKDGQGRIKKQACRFRVYGLDAKGRVIAEITAKDAEITWSVHLAARKAAWYQFNNAMDLGKYAKESLMRNAGTKRADLAIAPKPCVISGANTNADGSSRKYKITGKIAKKYPAELGELRCDDQGRLLVLGGPGDARSFAGHANPISTFANNEGWYDDIADGPVRARIKLKGSSESVEAEPAFVVTTPPNYGPGLLGVTTMYDLAQDLFHRESVGGHPKLELNETPSFTDNIFPILDRLVKTQWVSSGFFMLFGRDAEAEFTAPDSLERLSKKGDGAKQQRENEHARKTVFAWFRDPSSSRPRADAIPPFYGDAFGDFSGLPNDELSVTHTQYAWLARWAKGDFVEDWRGRPKARPLDKLPLKDQPAALDRAHLDDILGGPFHPGIEITWIMRRASMWKAPFRLNVLPEGEQPTDDYGPILTPAKCLGPDGPLYASGPGSLTRWMGTPWQTDSASCLAGYDASYYLPLPSFWAPRMPNEVLGRFAYERSIDPKLKERVRQRHFSYRSYWLRDLSASSGNARRQDMVENWWKLGIVAPMGPTKANATRAKEPSAWVETGRNATYTRDDPTRRMVEIAERHVGPALEGKGTPKLQLPRAKQAPPAGEDDRKVHIANRRRLPTRHDR